ncbi:hypothetical protein ACF0H5_003375 [Mactra antiquata]
MAYTLRINDNINLELEFEALLSRKIIYLTKDSVKPQKIGLNIEDIQKIVSKSRKELIPMRVGVNINSNVFRVLMNGFIEMLEEAECM